MLKKNTTVNSWTGQSLYTYTHCPIGRKICGGISATIYVHACGWAQYRIVSITLRAEPINSNDPLQTVENPTNYARENPAVALLKPIVSMTSAADLAVGKNRRWVCIESKFQPPCKSFTFHFLPENVVVSCTREKMFSMKFEVSTTLRTELMGLSWEGRTDGRTDSIVA